MRTALLLFLTAFQLFSLSAFGAAPPYPPSASIQAVVNQISADSLRAYIEQLSSFHTRHTYSDTASGTVGIGAAMGWVRAKAGSFGTDGRYFELVPYTQSWGGQPVVRHNVMCHVVGTENDSVRYLIGGHLDSRAANISDVTSLAPGADDNGSSCAAFLELLRVLPDSFAHNLDVIWFTGEEEGLYGSAALANEMATQQERVDGMICMDMIGHIALANGAVDSSSVRLYADGASDQGGTSSPSRQLQRYLRWVGESYVPDFDMHLIAAADRPGRGSDHLSFSAAGFPALRVIERNEDLAFQHNPNDVIGNMSCSYARKVAMVTFGGLLTMLQSPARPAPPLLNWENATLLHGQIPDSVALPQGGHFFLAIRNYYSSDFDSIVDLGTGREFSYTVADQAVIYGFSISRSNAAGFPSPFSSEIQSFTAEAGPARDLLPNRINLHAYPNPFNNDVTLSYELPVAGTVHLSVFDIMGRRVADLVSRPFSAGTQRAVWSPQRAASGIYLVRLDTDHDTITQKILYLR
ncbi:MAG TPA: M20/M25/M40 family metallo-hydrolase [bacterium]|jgi:hypothetical protein